MILKTINSLDKPVIITMAFHIPVIITFSLYITFIMYNHIIVIPRNGPCYVPDNQLENNCNVGLNKLERKCFAKASSN